MAQRDRDKSKRPAEANAGLGESVQRLEARVKALERERDGLKAELDAARSRIQTLDDNRKLVANRIDWVIDSLRSLSDNDA